MTMTKRERLEATVAGEDVDRPAVAFWRHFYHREQTTDGLVEAMVGFQRRFDWDFLKINPRACYHFEDWGNRYEFSLAGSASPRCVHKKIAKPEQWASLERLDPTTGVIGEHIAAISQIRHQLGDGVPLVMTVFTPLSIAAELAGDETLRQHMNHSEDLLHAGLETIADSFVGVIQACFDAGADGIFYATRGWGTRDRLDTSEYDSFARPYDLRLMEVMQERGWFNILHVCRSNNMLYHLMDLPVHGLNWDATDPTNPSIAEAACRCDRVLIGGVDADRLASDGPGEWLDHQLRDVAEGTGKRRWIVGGGCTAPSTISEAALDEVRAAAERL